MTWAGKVARNLLPLSVEQTDLATALREWEYTGYYTDLEEPCEHCQLCDHPDIRYQFEIRNRSTDHVLLVGSECILKFKIGGVSEDGTKLDSDETAKTVRSHRRGLILEAKRRRVIGNLLLLGQLDSGFGPMINSFIHYFQNRGAFTPHQLSTLVWRFETWKVAYTKSDFKVALARQRERDQLIAMPQWKVRQIWNCLSAPQRQTYSRWTGYRGEEQPSNPGRG